MSKSSLAASQFVAGIHPETDPEQSAGILSVLTGEKSLPEKWAVSFFAGHSFMCVPPLVSRLGTLVVLNFHGLKR